MGKYSRACKPGKPYGNGIYLAYRPKYPVLTGGELSASRSVYRHVELVATDCKFHPNVCSTKFCNKFFSAIFLFHLQENFSTNIFFVKVFIQPKYLFIKILFHPKMMSIKYFFAPKKISTKSLKM